jgi:hypothetical protein
MSGTTRTTNPHTNLHTNPDPITQESGSHAVGTGVGVVVDGAADIGSANAMGTVIRSVAGPVGMVAGAVIWRCGRPYIR